MKFLCGNCKAKYQIADEKVTGRTLRMKCRRCGHDILIDGHATSQSVPPASQAPAPRRTGSTVSVVPGPRSGAAAALPARAGSPALPRPTASRSKPPSAMSQEFRRHVAAPPEVPQRSAPYDLWHVAIQDVPVGPMTRDELSRKIEAGAVTAESLSWREGMDDWRPIGELAELASLLRRNREPSRPLRGRPPPNVPGPGATGSRPHAIPAGAQPDEYDEDNAEPTRISEFSPEMASLAQQASSSQHFSATSSQQLPAAASTGGTSPKVIVAPQAVSPLADQQTHVVAQPAQGRNLSSWTMLAVGLLGGIVIVSGPLIFQHWWSSPEKPAQASVAQTPARSRAPEKVAPAEVELPSDEPDMEIKPDEIATTKPRTGSAKPATPKPAEAAKAPAGKQLSDEQRKLLERMGGGSNDPDLNKLARNSEESRGPVASELTPQQLTKVVQDNKNQLQRCYETALRAAGGKQDSAIKISVNVTVGGSGTAKSVSTTGDGLGNMTDCIRSAVKHWRFPQAQSESEFAFPLVFQPGA